MQSVRRDEQAARRLSIWNGFDLTTNSGVRAAIEQIDMLDPEHVWLSPDCGPYSQMQNLNQRTEAQREALAAKRKNALKQYVGCSILFQHVTWELSQTCQAWRLPLLQNIQREHRVHVVVTRGCCVNLKDNKGQYVSKGWKLMTTHPLLSTRMDLPCRCSSHVKHTPCEGKLTRRSAFYTKEFAVRVC